MKLKPFTPTKYRRRVFGQLWMLALQFVLGMILNLIGEDATGALRVFTLVVLIAHILNAVGLVEGGIYIALKDSAKLTWVAAAMVTGTLVSGVLTVRTHQEVWSFVMACGFLASAWLYGALYLRIDRQLHG